MTEYEEGYKLAIEHYTAYFKAHVETELTPYQQGMKEGREYVMSQLEKFK